MRNDERSPSVLEALGALGEPDTRDERFRAELAAVLLARASSDQERLRTRPPVSRRRERRVRPAAALATLLVAVVLVAGFVVAGHRSASAEALLRRVAAVAFAPNQARHLVYEVTMTLSGRVTKGTGEIWIATGAAGKPPEVSDTLRLAKARSAPPLVVERDTQTRLGTYTYDATHNAIIVPSRNDPSWSTRESSTLPLPLYLFDGTTAAQRLADFASRGAARVRLLSKRTVDGVTVDAVRADGWPNGDAIRTTFYFDADTHLLRGFDSQGVNASSNSPVWHVRLVRQSEGPRDAAPKDVFALSAPPSAQVQPPPPAMAALMQLCRSELKPLLSRGETLTDACRAANSGVSQDALMRALVGSARQDLAAAVAARAITPSQARAALQAQRTQIITTISAHRPSVHPIAAPAK